jgi:hypothetical protein
MGMNAALFMLASGIVTISASPDALPFDTHAIFSPAEMNVVGATMGPGRLRGGSRRLEECRKDICGDIGNDCVASSWIGESASCTEEGYEVVEQSNVWGTMTYCCEKPSMVGTILAIVLPIIFLLLIIVGAWFCCCRKGGCCNETQPQQQPQQQLVIQGAVQQPGYPQAQAYPPQGQAYPQQGYGQPQIMQPQGQGGFQQAPGQQGFQQAPGQQGFQQPPAQGFQQPPAQGFQPAPVGIEQPRQDMSNIGQDMSNLPQADAVGKM